MRTWVVAADAYPLDEQRCDGSGHAKDQVVEWQEHQQPPGRQALVWRKGAVIQEVIKREHWGQCPARYAADNGKDQQRPQRPAPQWYEAVGSPNTFRLPWLFTIMQPATTIHGRSIRATTF